VGGGHGQTCAYCAEQALCVADAARRAFPNVILDGC